MLSRAALAVLMPVALPQIVHLFKASLKLDGLAMPNLERLALYLDADAGCADPFFVYDPAKPYQACAALAPIGDMISGTVWPNVTQARNHAPGVVVPMLHRCGALQQIRAN